ncbi:MAG: prephenate dehydratase [Pseudomonadales bacterium]|nr:prephenate dehydratase [Pseudomonadales bacterium]
MTRAPSDNSRIDTWDSVAYLGPAGTHSHAAVRKYFGDKRPGLPVVEISDVFARVEEGLCEFGLVPVENSTEGSVAMTLDCFSTSAVTICAEVMLRIHHFFLVAEQTDPDALLRIVSHQQSLAQCRKWLNDHYPGLERVSVSSNAEAARIASQQPGVAAIAGKTAAELYGLRVLASEIEDSRDNTTRFLVISRTRGRTKAGKHNKTSIIISTSNKPGALFKALEPFHRFDISLIKLESRPSRLVTWDYSFYVDFEGHVDDERVRQALAELQAHALEVKILGSYPVAI